MTTAGTRFLMVLAVAASVAAGCGGNGTTSPNSADVETTADVTAPSTSDASSETTSTPDATSVEAAEVVADEPLSLDSLPGKIAFQGVGCSEVVDDKALADAMTGVDSVEEAMAALGTVMDLDAPFGICTINPDGTGLTGISDPTADADYVGWTYDGSMLYYFGPNGWMVTDTDGSNPRPWTDATNLIWRTSPDGTQYVNQSVHDLAIYVTPVGQEKTGPGRRAVLSGSVECCSTFRWSPDSKWLLYYVGDNCPAIWKVNVESLQTVQLTGPGSPSGDIPVCAMYDSATWSPDGSTILFIDYEGVSVDMRPFLIDPDGSDLRPLFRDDRFPDPSWMVDVAAWSPDSRAIVVSMIDAVGGSGLFVTSPDGEQLLPIPNGPDGPVTLAWAPDVPPLQPLPDQDLDVVRR